MPIIPVFLSPRPSRLPLRVRLAGAVERLAASLAQPAPSVVRETTQPADVEPEALAVPVDEADVPDLAEIEAAAAAYAKAAEQARAADRGKRRAKKVLDLVPAGRWGGWLVERVPSGRQTVDLEAVRATYARLGLGEVPMKDAAPSLKVSRAADTTPDAELADAELRALAGAR